MPSPNDDIPQPEPPPVRPPILPPDFPDIPQNPSSELQPPPSPAATPDKFAGTAPVPAEPETCDVRTGASETRSMRFWKSTRSYGTLQTKLR
jgi:hypothetical protein